MKTTMPPLPTQKDILQADRETCDHAMSPQSELARLFNSEIFKPKNRTGGRLGFDVNKPFAGESK